MKIYPEEVSSSFATAEEQLLAGPVNTLVDGLQSCVFCLHAVTFHGLTMSSLCVLFVAGMPKPRYKCNAPAHPIQAFIPLWVLPTRFSALSAGAFFLQCGVQGAWGIVSQTVQSGDTDLSSAIVVGADSTGRIVTSIVPCHFPWCCISAGKCEHSLYSVEDIFDRRSQMISSASAQIEASMCVYISLWTLDPHIHSCW
jgi:hypothetical protein